MIAVNSFDAVVPGQALVEIGMITLDQLQHAAVFSEHLFKQPFRLLTHGLTEVFIKVGKASRIRGEAFQVPQVEPLIGEVGDQTR